MKKALTLIAASALFASPALAGDMNKASQYTPHNSDVAFSSYDADGNGEVTFAEFNKHAKKMNMSTTKAAQLFTRMSGGSATLTQSNFQTAALSNPDGFLTSTRNTAVLSSTSSSNSMSNSSGTMSSYGNSANEMNSYRSDMSSSNQSYGNKDYSDTSYNGMSINPDAGLNSTSPLQSEPSDQTMDSESTYGDFERTGEYDEPLGN